MNVRSYVAVRSYGFATAGIQGIQVVLYYVCVTVSSMYILCYMVFTVDIYLHVSAPDSLLVGLLLSPDRVGLESWLEL